jgi:hypothetical protein
MRILIYALPRTGSNNLTHYIANSLHYKEIIEPYNEYRFWDIDITESDIWERDNVVVKMMIGQGEEKYEDVSTKFDKTVILYRENIIEQAESFVHATKSVDWHAPYTYDPSKVDQNEYLETLDKFNSRLEKIKSYNHFTVTYENLYLSGTDRDRLDEYIGITNKSFRFILDSNNKYRRDNTGIKKTLI